MGEGERGMTGIKCRGEVDRQFGKTDGERGEIEG